MAGPWWTESKIRSIVQALFRTYTTGAVGKMVRSEEQNSVVLGERPTGWPMTSSARSTMVAANGRADRSTTRRERDEKRIALR
jgi:hypothetical protein